MNKDYIIIMADILDSSKADQALLMHDFTEIVSEINLSLKSSFLSPLTITLGDEFQGVISSLGQAILVMQHLEEAIINHQKSFKLRYVIVEGSIDTPINKEIAYGMMGEGLSRARRMIEDLKKSESRFHFELRDMPKSASLTSLYIALQSIIDTWNPRRDYALVSSFLKSPDYKEVAIAMNKVRSLMWKRNRSLKLDAYHALQKVAAYIGGKNND